MGIVICHVIIQQKTSIKEDILNNQALLLSGWSTL